MTGAAKLEIRVMREAVAEAVRLLEAQSPEGSMGRRHASALAEILSLFDEMQQPASTGPAVVLDLDAMERRARDDDRAHGDHAWLGDDVLALVAEVRALRGALAQVADVGRLHASWKLPKHVTMTVEHQPHAAYYQTVADWLETAKSQDHCDVLPEDAAKMLETGEVWVVHWYPNTPVGFCAVGAATLERALALANDDVNAA